MSSPSSALPLTSRPPRSNSSPPGRRPTRALATAAPSCGPAASGHCSPLRSGLLQEAGSVEFLEQFAGRMETGQGPSSRWFGLSRDPIALRAEAQDFTTELERLQSQRDAATFGSDFLARRRGRVASLGDTELAALEKSAATFESLAAVDRRTLARLATALADPAATSLHDAARLWHLIIAATNPAQRDRANEDRLMIHSS